MKTNNAEVITNRKAEGNIKDLVRQAEMNAEKVAQEAQEAEEEKRRIEMELMEAQASHEKREEAERQGKETADKVAELTG